MELLFIRHALPIRVDGDDDDAPADPHLSELGRRQADALTRWLAHEQVDALWSSPMRRARETAAPIAEARGLEVVVDEGLVEFDRHASSYIPVEELKAAGDPRWNEMPEQPEEFRAGVVDAVERIVAAHPGQIVAVVCHGGVVNAYAGHVLRHEDPLFFLPDYTSISRVLAAGSGERSIKSLNETAHLRDLRDRARAREGPVPPNRPLRALAPQEPVRSACSTSRTRYL